MLPLYLDSNDEFLITRGTRKPNLNQEFVEAFGFAINLEFLHDRRGDLEVAFGPEDVFHYIYAVLHSPEYRRRYADFLKSDFPRVPLISNRALFGELIRIGERLVGLHLMEEEGRDTQLAWQAWHGVGDNQVEGVRYAPPTGGVPGRVWINRRRYFEGVAPEVRALTCWTPGFWLVW